MECRHQCAWHKIVGHFESAGMSRRDLGCEKQLPVASIQHDAHKEGASDGGRNPQCHPEIVLQA